MSTFDLRAETAAARLVGRTYEEVGGCYGATRAVLAAAGIDLPADQAEALSIEPALATPILPGEAARTGDVVVMPGRGDDRLHVGVALDAWRVLHATRGQGVVVTQLSALRRAGLVLRVLRPRQGSAMTHSDARVAAGTVRVTIYEDPLGRVVPTSADVRLPVPGMTARLLAASLAGRDDLAVAVNGRALRDGQDPVLRPGDHLAAAPTLGEPASLIFAAIGIVASLASGFLLRPRLPAARTTADPEERRYGFARFSNDAFAGDVVPVVLGEIPRYGGKIIAQVPGSGADGSGDETLRILVCLGHGPVAMIGDRTADFDRVAGDAIAGVWLNDQPLSTFPGCVASGRLGTPDQQVIRGFEDVDTLVEVGVGGVALRNTSGAERTGSDASGEAHTYTTGGPVHTVTPRIRFAQGLYRTSETAQLEPHRAKYRYRTRLTAGPGAWSGWTVVTVEKALRAEWFSAPRIGLVPEGDPPAQFDVQIERVSPEPTDALRVDAMTWDSTVDTLDAENTYAGFAVLALELRASEQLTGVPRVSARVRGIGDLRVWDGVSDPSAPVFGEGWSDNPADQALEIITNTTWGMGARYGDADVDMPSLLAWRATCDQAVPRPGGGVRPRYACNIEIGEDRPGEDWLRTICRAGECTPITVGGVWHFVQDEAQPTPAERFTDGSIAVEPSTGAAIFEYAREHAEGGARPNQIAVQFANHAADGAPDVLVYPEDGSQWLATEPTSTLAVRLDGVTDVDQVASMARREMKRVRFLTRTVAFVTSREAIVVRPGERFDLAMSLPGWGLASGRLESGCTTTTIRTDRGVTLAESVAYVARVMHLDGSVEVRDVASPAGTYQAGEEITLAASLAQAPEAGAEYALGEDTLEMKPFTCTAVRVHDADAKLWRIEGVEYDDEVYDDAAETVTFPAYSTLRSILVPPGPVTELRAFEGVSAGTRTASLAWRQTPEDAQITSSFKIYRRVVGTVTWILVPEARVATRGAVLDVTDPDRGYEFVVVAVSLGGSHLSPDDPRVPRAVLVLGLSAEPPPPPTGLTATNTGGNTYTLSWDEVEGAVGYQVLAGGDATGLPNAGAEDCLVLARTAETQLPGLELPPAAACTFWVRSVGPNGRLSFAAASVEVSSPATPAGEAIKLSTLFDLEADGTPANLAWNGVDERLELVNANLAGVWTSPEIDTGAMTLTELTTRPHTANDADDPPISTDPFAAPSIAADQWGIVATTPKVVGMLFPPWPDTEHAWSLEVRTHDGVVWTDWQSLGWFASVRRMFDRYQVRVTMRRGRPPYRPALRTIRVVTTH